MSECKANRFASTWEYSPCGKPTVAEARGANDADYDCCLEHALVAHEDGQPIRWYGKGAPPWDSVEEVES